MPRKRSTASKYRLVRPIGRGAFADVFEAVDSTTGEHVACKVLKDKVQEAQARYEYTMSRLLKHPNIVAAKDFVVTSSGDVLLIQELVQGGELFDVIENDYGVDEDLARSVMLDLINALQYMHSVSVVHRDVKPENVLLTKTGSAKLCDMGMAEYAGDVVARGLGTVPYMPPEVLRSPRTYVVDPSYDVWSTGIVLYVLLVGDWPWLKASEEDAEFLAFVDGDRSTYPWNSFSPQLRELFEKVFTLRVDERCSLEDMKHVLLTAPFFQKAPSATTQAPSSKTASTSGSKSAKHATSSRQQQHQHHNKASPLDSMSSTSSMSSASSMSSIRTASLDEFVTQFENTVLDALAL